jgi:hypothetical protein
MPNSAISKYYDNNVIPVNIPEYESDAFVIDMDISSNEEGLPWLREYIETNWENEQSTEYDDSKSNNTEVSMALKKTNMKVIILSRCLI